MRRKGNTHIRSIVQVIIEVHKADECIDPVKIATEAMEKLGAAVLQKAMPPVYQLAHLQLCRIVRHLCRKRFDKDEGELDQNQRQMFPGLRSHYPSARSGKESSRYVLREAMTAKDVEFNVRRLRAAVASKQTEARALQAWWDMKLENLCRGTDVSQGEPTPRPIAAE